MSRPIHLTTNTNKDFAVNLIFIYKKFFNRYNGITTSSKKLCVDEVRSYLLKKHATKVMKVLNNFCSNEPAKIFDFACNFFLRSIKPIQIKEEFIKLLNLMKKIKPMRIMEIGTSNGGTLLCFCKLAPDNATLISIDLPEECGGYPRWKMPIYQSFARENQSLYLIRNDSHRKETYETVKKNFKYKSNRFSFY